MGSRLKKWFCPSVGLSSKYFDKLKIEVSWIYGNKLATVWKPWQNGNYLKRKKAESMERLLQKCIRVVANKFGDIEKVRYTDWIGMVFQLYLKNILDNGRRRKEGRKDGRTKWHNHYLSCSSQLIIQIHIILKKEDGRTKVGSTEERTEWHSHYLSCSLQLRKYYKCNFYPY